ncbi:MAG TPA: S1 family peptidase [Pseudonocardiaceae bacterium]
MKPKKAARMLGAALLAAGAAASFSPATAGAAPDVASPEMFAAMQRDLGLTAEQATARLAQEKVANEAEKSLRGTLGAAFGGAHFDAAKGKLVVGITDLSVADKVRKAGAEPKLVSRSEAQLDSIKSKLDSVTSVPAGVTGSYVDVTTNSIVITVRPGATEAGKALAAAAGKDVNAVRVVESDENPQTFYDLRGGDAIYMGGGRCSLGFAVTTGYVTAGHCGTTGTRVSGYNGVAQGTFAGSSFPGNDYAYVRTNSNWTPRPWVNRYNGSNVVVRGSTEAAVGASVCRSGSTTGWHCGTIQAKNQTVYYSQGAVSGLTRTTVCAEPGDSGGSYISGSQAQGVTSGGSGNCTYGGTTYFQPVNEILNAYGLTLVRG